MKIDFKDLEIFRILNQENLTAYNLAQFIFPDSNVRDWSDKSQSIKSRLRKLLKYNLVLSEERSKKRYYKINEKNTIYLKDLKIPIKKKQILFLPNVFLIKTNNDKWNIYQF